MKQEFIKGVLVRPSSKKMPIFMVTEDQAAGRFSGVRLTGSLRGQTDHNMAAYNFEPLPAGTKIEIEQELNGPWEAGDIVFNPSTGVKFVLTVKENVHSHYIEVACLTDHADLDWYAGHVGTVPKEDVKLFARREAARQAAMERQRR